MDVHLRNPTFSRFGSGLNTVGCFVFLNFPHVAGHSLGARTIGGSSQNIDFPFDIRDWYLKQ